MESVGQIAYKLLFLFLLLQIIVSDRFCQISETEKCGESLKSGNCNLISTDKYDYFEFDYDLISMESYKGLILKQFNKDRNSIHFEIHQKKRERANVRQYPMFERIFDSVIIMLQMCFSFINIIICVFSRNGIWDWKS